MDYHIKQEKFVISDVILDEVKEQPIDVDFSLPDYCPNIQQILKYKVTPKINSRNILSDRLEIEGIAIISVFYLDSHTPTLRVCEHSMPFTCFFSLKDTYSQDALVFTSTKTEYVNCRAVSSRRLDIHGAFSINARVFDKKESEVTSNIEGDNIEQKKSTLKISNVVAVGSEQFVVEEGIEAGPSHQNISYIVRSEVDMSLIEHKTVSDKIIVKGEATLRILYVCDQETSELKTCEYFLPVSQVINVAEAVEGADAEVVLDVLSHNVSERVDPAEGTFLDIEINACATAIVYEDKELETVQDVYSVDYNLETTSNQKTTLRLHSFLNENYSNKFLLNLSDRTISSILDVWNETVTVKATKEENQIVLKGKLNVCVLAKDSEENLFYVERLIDFEHQKHLDEDLDEIFLKPRSKVGSFAYRIIDINTLELRFDLKISSSIYSITKATTISDIIVNEDQPKEKETSALTIYYADTGEEIWDIAKSHNTSPETIKAQNDLQTDILKEDTMLLIPIA